MTELLRTGARQLLQQAIEAEVQELLLHSRQAAGRRQGRRGAQWPPSRTGIQTGIGPVTVQIPKVRAKTGKPITFRSALVPPYVRKTQSLEAASFYLKGVSTGEMSAALEVLVGPEARGLSASTVSRLKRAWADEYQAWGEEPLDKDRWVYVGRWWRTVAERPSRQALRPGDHWRERTWREAFPGDRRRREGIDQSWREVLLKLKSRGMNVPQLAVGDGAMGFWAALEEVYPTTRQQRCWMHKTMNVLNCLPKSLSQKTKTGFA